MPPEKGAELQGVRDGLRCEVLVAEGDDLALGHKARELGLSGVGEAAELHAADLRTRSWGQMCNGRAAAEKVRIGLVGVLAGVMVLEGLERGVGLVFVPGGEVLGILGKKDVSRCMTYTHTIFMIKYKS